MLERIGCRLRVPIDQDGAEPAGMPRPPSQHRAAFELSRSPIMALLEQVIAGSKLDQIAKRQALAAAEQMFVDTVVCGRASCSNPWPAVRLLEAFDIRPARIEQHNAFLIGTTPAGEPFAVALPPDPPCPAIKDRPAYTRGEEHD